MTDDHVLTPTKVVVLLRNKANLYQVKSNYYVSVNNVTYRVKTETMDILTCAQAITPIASEEGKIEYILSPSPVFQKISDKN